MFFFILLIYLSFSVPEYLSHRSPVRQLAKDNAGHHLSLQILHPSTTCHQVVHGSSWSDYNIVYQNLNTIF